METVYNRLCTSIDEICAAHPCVSAVPFGRSYLGRTIPALQLGGGGHRLLYLGGMTGSVRTAALLLRFVRDYAAAVQGGRRVAGIDISYLRNTRSITVVPLLNVDGAVLRCDGTDAENPLLERLSMMCSLPTPDPGEVCCASSDSANPFAGWVCNGRGVDLRRNFDASFAEAMASAGGIGGPGYPGMHPESEPDCAAAASFLRGAATTDLTLHFLDAADERTDAGRISWYGADHRTRSIAQILARDIDGKGYETASSGITCSTASAGSIGEWYRTRHSGPLLEITLPVSGIREVPRGEDAASMSGDARDAADHSCHALLDAASQNPGDTLANAALTLQYGKIRKLLFHGAVL